MAEPISVAVRRGGTVESLHRVHAVAVRSGEIVGSAGDSGLVTFMRYDANVRSPKAHSHREQEEAYVVVSGSGRIRLDDAVHDLRQWDVVRVSPTTVRAFEAGDEGLELIAVGSDRPEGGDGVFAETAWV